MPTDHAIVKMLADATSDVGKTTLVTYHVPPTYQL